MDLATYNWQCRKALVYCPNVSLAGGCSSWCGSGFVPQEAPLCVWYNLRVALEISPGAFPSECGELPHSHTSPHSLPMATERGAVLLCWAGSQKHHRFTDDSSSPSNVSDVTHAGSEAEYLHRWHDHLSPFSLGVVKRYNTDLCQTLIKHRLLS